MELLIPGTTKMNINITQSVSSLLKTPKKRERSTWQEEPDQTKFNEAWTLIVKGHNRFKAHNLLSRAMGYGVPKESRLDVWTWCLGLGTYREKNAQPSKEIIDLIKCDLPRTHGGKHGGEVLYDVLVALSHPESLGTYCQGLNYLAVIFLQAANGDERARHFAILGVEKLIEKLLMKTYFYDGMRQLRADIVVLSEYVELCLPHILPLFKQEGVDLNYCAANWFLCLYANIDLPYSEVFRLWDYIICEGFGGVIRIAMALLEYSIPEHEAHILEHDDIAKRVKYFPGVLAQELLNMACEYELPAKEVIAERRHRQLQEIGKKDSEIELTNNLRRHGGRPLKVFW